MNDINTIHKFYEANLPEYERNDIHKCNDFFIRQLGLHNCKKPIVWILKNFDRFTEYVALKWAGADEISEKPIVQKSFEAREERFNEHSIMPYGKYSGQKLFDIPLDYLQWLKDNKRASKYVLDFIQWRQKQFRK